MRYAVLFLAIATLAGCVGAPPPPPPLDSETSAESSGSEGSGDESSTGGDEEFGVDMQGEPCIGPGVSLHDRVTGTAGMSYTCMAISGEGAGTIPNGIAFDTSDCSISGSMEEDLNGSWAFLVRAERFDGERFFVPYCVGNQDVVSDEYDIIVDHGEHLDVEGSPGVGVFTPGAELWHDPANLIIEMTHADCSPLGACEHGIDVTPSEGVVVELHEEIDGGVRYRVGVDGPPAPASFVDRPYIVSVHAKLCVETGSGFCASPDSIGFHGRGAIQLSVLLLPE